jgi:hypothetical protein
MLVAQRLPVGKVDRPVVQRSQVDHVPPGLALGGRAADQLKALLQQAVNPGLLLPERFYGQAAAITETNDPASVRIAGSLLRGATESDGLDPRMRHPHLLRPTGNANPYEGKYLSSLRRSQHATAEDIPSLEEKQIVLSRMLPDPLQQRVLPGRGDRKSTRLNSSH